MQHGLMFVNHVRGKSLTTLKHIGKPPPPPPPRANSLKCVNQAKRGLIFVTPCSLVLPQTLATVKKLCTLLGTRK
jgi:hypothetical protein